MRWVGLRDRYVGEVGRYDVDYGLLILNPYNINNGTPFRDHVWLQWDGDIPPCGSMLTFYATTSRYEKRWVVDDEEKRKLQLGLVNPELITLEISAEIWEKLYSI